MSDQPIRCDACHSNRPSWQFYNHKHERTVTCFRCLFKHTRNRQMRVPGVVDEATNDIKDQALKDRIRDRLFAKISSWVAVQRDEHGTAVPDEFIEELKLVVTDYPRLASATDPGASAQPTDPPENQPLTLSFLVNEAKVFLSTEDFTKLQNDIAGLDEDDAMEAIKGALSEFMDFE